MRDHIDIAWRKPGDQQFVRVSSLSDYQASVAAFTRPRVLPTSQTNRFLYRGSASSTFDLRPTLARLMEGREWLTVALLHHLETECTNAFASRVQLLLGRDVTGPKRTPTTVEMNESIHRWQYMQHYGAATRLLDWTASPYVALYFAVEKDPEADGAVWIVDYGGIHDRMMEFRIDTGLPPKMPLVATPHAQFRDEWGDVLLFFPCASPDERMVAQLGWFSCAAVPEKDHSEAIANVMMKYGKAGEWTLKLVIDREAKQRIARELWSMNISHATLYPGLDGYGQSLRRWVDLLKPEPMVGFKFEDGILAAFANH